MLKLYRPRQIVTLIFFINLIAGAFTSNFAQWEGWDWRRAVTITNTSGSTLTDYQIKINLNGSNFNFSNTNNDGSDVRITTSDGITELPFWIEEWDQAGEQATIWVKISSIPTTELTLYLYYGNLLANSVSDGANTFKFFDNLDTPVPGNWVRRLLYSSGNWGPGTVPHDWKYSMEMQQGALYYASERVQNGWATESLDEEIEQEFDFIHILINPDGTVIPDTFLVLEPQYCYGVLLSNLALGYLYFETINPTVSFRCYNDMVRVFDYLRVTYPNVSQLSDAGGYGWLLVGYSNAWKAFTAYGNTTGSSQALILVQTYTAYFLGHQAVTGSWDGANGIQEHLKRNFGMLNAYDVTGDFSYLTAVKDNIDYILETFWIPSNGGLEWYSNHATSNHFYECHQQWFMTSIRALYNKSGGAYDYLDEGLDAWHFLTDNNYANIDMYVHNYLNHNAFFSYRQVLEDGTVQYDNWKGSYEIGSALMGMSLNYDWVFNYQSSHSNQPYNYLNELVKQIKNSPSNKGFTCPLGSTINPNIWKMTGSPGVSIVEDDGKYVLSLVSGNTHFNYVTSIDKSFSDFIFETKVKLTYDINNQCTPEIAFRYSNNDNNYITMLRGEGLIGGGGANGDLFIRKYQGGVQTNPIPYPAYDYTANYYYKYKIVANHDTIEQYLDDNLISTWNDAGTSILMGGVGLGNYGNNSYPVYYDDIHIRSYASVEPTTIVGSEEVNPLPVELNSFSASVSGSTIKLNWITETEVNNYGFEILRFAQNDRLGWIKIGFVLGNGNSNSPKYYSYEDKDISVGKYSYRLKQIDTDGQFEYSKVIEVNLGSPMKFGLSQNYPNPFNPVTTIQYSIAEAGKVSLTVYNILGEQVAELVNETKKPGVYTVNFDASELNSGIYIYKLSAGNFSAVKKLILVK